MLPKPREILIIPITLGKWIISVFQSGHETLFPVPSCSLSVDFKDCHVEMSFASNVCSNESNSVEPHPLPTIATATLLHGAFGYHVCVPHIRWDCQLARQRRLLINRFLPLCSPRSPDACHPTKPVLFRPAVAAEALLLWRMMVSAIKVGNGKTKDILRNGIHLITSCNTHQIMHCFLGFV